MKENLEIDEEKVLKIDILNYLVYFFGFMKNYFFLFLEHFQKTKKREIGFKTDFVLLYLTNLVKLLRKKNTYQKASLQFSFHHANIYRIVEYIFPIFFLCSCPFHPTIIVHP